MNKNETPTKIGVEIEAAYPPVYPTLELKKLCDAFWMSILSRGFHYGTPCDIFSYNARQSRNVSNDARGYSIHPWEEFLPEKYRTPGGWERGWEGNNFEFRFMGPADTIKETFTRYDNLQTFMDEWKVRAFEGCGTHVHLGVADWIRTHFPTHSLSYDTWYTTIPSKLLYGFFIQRSHLIEKFVPVFRRNGCGGSMYNSCSGLTSLLDIHNFWLRESACVPWAGALQPARKGLPTFEVRLMDGTHELNVVKGWTAFLIALMKTAERMFTLELLDKCATRGTQDTPASHVLPPTSNHSIDHLKAELRETGFWVAPIISWMDETLKRNGDHAPFEGSLHEIYPDSDTGTDSNEGSQDNSTPKDKARTARRKSEGIKAPVPLAAAA